MHAARVESRVEQTNKKRTDVVKGNRVRERGGMGIDCKGDILILTTVVPSTFFSFRIPVDREEKLRFLEILRNSKKFTGFLRNSEEF